LNSIWIFTSLAIGNSVEVASSTSVLRASDRVSMYAAVPLPFCASVCISASL
jgi:hypothetical protein